MLPPRRVPRRPRVLRVAQHVWRHDVSTQGRAAPRALRRDAPRLLRPVAAPSPRATREDERHHRARASAASAIARAAGSPTPAEADAASAPDECRVPEDTEEIYLTAYYQDSKTTIRARESGFGNVVADAFLAAGRRFAETDTNVDSPQMAITNGGGLRTDVLYDAGDITDLQVQNILPFFFSDVLLLIISF